MSFLLAVVGLLLLVLIHEAGHFLAAKAVGMRATKFYVGFPPALAKVRRGDTEYGLGAIPLGGYVRIVGMARPRPQDLRNVADAVAEAAQHRAEGEPDRLTPALERTRRALSTDDARDMLPSLQALQAALEEERALIDPERMEWCERELTRLLEDADPRAYWRAATWRRLTAIAAGPLANVLTAVVILTAFYGVGVPTYKATQTVDAVGRNSPALKMGLQHGDTILRANGKAVGTSDAVRSVIQQGGPVTLVVRRNGERVVLGPARPQKGPDGSLVLGFVFDTQRDGTLHFGPVGAVHAAWDDMWFTTTSTLKALANVVRGQDREQLSSAVGIVQVSADSVHTGYYWRLLALISLSLALFNALPFLPLDGGHMLFAIIEALRRRPIRREVYERVSAIGIAAMLLLFFVGLQNDIGRITDGPNLTP
jgi:regulator of sigma E protease